MSPNQERACMMRDLVSLTLDFKLLREFPPSPAATLLIIL